MHSEPLLEILPRMNGMIDHALDDGGHLRIQRVSSVQGPLRFQVPEREQLQGATVNL